MILIGYEGLSEGDMPKILRDQIVNYLTIHMSGHQDSNNVHDCRCCTRSFYGQECTDETYSWPIYLRHYVGEHHTNLPQDFIDHILAKNMEEYKLGPVHSQDGSEPPPGLGYIPPSELPMRVDMTFNPEGHVQVSGMAMPSGNIFRHQSNYGDSTNQMSVDRYNEYLVSRGRSNTERYVGESDDEFCARLERMLLIRNITYQNRGRNVGISTRGMEDD